jgi:hypothetical protein
MRAFEMLMGKLFRRAKGVPKMASESAFGFVKFAVILIAK